MMPNYAGGWDNSSDGRSSGSDIMQRRVGYERQMKREYNARHSNRMNKLTDESAMEVWYFTLFDFKMRVFYSIVLENHRYKVFHNISFII